MIIIRAIVIVLGIFFALIFTNWLLVPTLYDQMCLINTNQCLRIEYQKYLNTALIHVVNSDMWLWYTGKYLVIYTSIGELQCDDGYSPTIIYDKDSTIQNLSRYCVRSLSFIKEFYNNNTKKTYKIFEKVMNPNNIDAFQTLQIFFDKKILF
jgi:hypothetical protein